MAVTVYENPKNNRIKRVYSLITFLLAAIIGPIWWFFNGLFLRGLALMLLGALIIAATGELYYALVLQVSFGIIANNSLHDKYVKTGWKVIESSPIEKE